MSGEQLAIISYKRDGKTYLLSMPTDHAEWAEQMLGLDLAVPDAATEIARSLARASTITGADAEAIAGASMKLAALGEIADLVYENASLKAERDDLATRLSEYLCDSTGGLLSKTGYDVRTMVAHTEEYYDRVYAEERKEVEAERDAALAAIERVRAVHRKFTYYELEDSCPDTSEEHREERHHESDEIGEFYCEDMPTGDVVCDLCRDADGERMDWPCPTVAALDGAPEPEGNP